MPHLLPTLNTTRFLIKRALLYTCAMVVSMQAVAQGPLLLNSLRSDTSTCISLGMGAEYYSNHIKADFLLSVYTRGQLLQQDLQQVANKQIDNYTIAYNDVIAIDYNHRLANGMLITAGIHRQDQVYTQLSHDLLSLAAYGNTPFKGDTLKVQDDQLFGLTTWELKLGLTKLFSLGKASLLASAQVSFIEANRFIHLGIGPSSLYTGVHGERVELAYDYSYGIQRKGSAFSGMGLGLGGELTLFNPAKYSVGLSIGQIGFLQFGNDRFIQTEQSGNMAFDGIFYPYPALSGFGSDSQHIDTIQHFKEQLLQYTVSETYRFGLPVQLGLRANVALGNKSSVHARFTYTGQLSERYIVNFSYAYAIGRHWQVWADLSKAGFSGQGLGMGAGYHSESIALNLQVRGLLPLAANSPQAVYVKCAYFL